MRRITSIVVAFLALTWLAAPALADRSNAHFKRGMAYKRKGQFDKAVESFKLAVAENEKHGQAWASLGHIYKKQKKYGDAIGAYEKATGIVKNDAVLWSNLGMSYYRATRADDALVALEKACRLAPRNAEIHANLGAIRRQKKQYKKALKNLRWAVKLAPKEAPYHNNLALALRVHGSNTPSEKERESYYTKATNHFKKAIALDANEPRYYFNIAVVYRRWEKIDEAIKYYKLALDKQPNMHAAWYDLGHMHRLNHDNELAIEAFTKYLKLTGGKDAAQDKEVREAIEALGGKY